MCAAAHSGVQGLSSMREVCLSPMALAWARMTGLDWAQESRNPGMPSNSVHPPTAPPPS
eukprot:CAMPEP_0174363184 /NCGR_PEP_ID=MMETSP0811_2-20130205/67767_1 /TAXON_ID=73025 ORGANISM="Eutreptiella gymnastica-like, Strain CCMP1594" /NCGR_SAMPLE_ID=MMETSP0811_2 /ASSEMBLY_ACC=CAM_ASM_000667 /LENGTH=58 /DNA_ID=CAMNT_0015501629 /DNA_START=70 /DNA_END=243 /DNA_ORIENTATION=+